MNIQLINLFLKSSLRYEPENFQMNCSSVFNYLIYNKAFSDSTIYLQETEIVSQIIALVQNSLRHTPNLQQVILPVQNLLKKSNKSHKDILIQVCIYRFLIKENTQIQELKCSDLLYYINYYFQEITADLKNGAKIEGLNFDQIF